jgi:glyoxylase-like metal-dependent hydrolase (beta-lactamase superfamily II)
VDRRLRDGDALAMAGRTLRVLHRPGHSPSDTVLYDEDHGVAIAGDHLLRNVSSNALISRPLEPLGAGDGQPVPRPRPLLAYRTSLRATRALDADVVVGGHGPPVVDHRDLIDERIRRQDARADDLLGLLSGGPRSAHQLATALWRDVAVTQAYLTLSEVLGHLDLLIDGGLVVEHDRQPVTTFEAV